LIVFTDNKPIVNALEYARMPPGIFNLVDGACAMNKTDEKLHADIKQQHGNSTVVLFPKFAKELSFIVKHTARDVEYLTDGFVEKNKDELSPFLK
jgi:myosin heavy subunit